MVEAGFIESTLINVANREILARLPSLGLSDAWLVSGALFQTVWNRLTNRPLDYGIRDYDIFYFDADTSKSAIRRVFISGMTRNSACPTHRSSARPTASIAS